MAIPPAPLLEKLKDNRCILFLGFGFSTAAGYPSWPDLIAKLVDEAAEPIRNKLRTSRSMPVRKKISCWWLNTHEIDLDRNDTATSCKNCFLNQ